MDVSCSVAIHNLVFTDDSLTSFDTNYKVSPPLRTQNDTDALIAGLKDGTIDMVTSDHNPLNIELKNIEFDYADYLWDGQRDDFMQSHETTDIPKPKNK